MQRALAAASVLLPGLALAAPDSPSAAGQEPARVLYSLETAHWFCGSVAQTFAALTALVGLFAVYKLQQIRADRDRSVGEILGALAAATGIINRHARSEADRIDYPVWVTNRRGRQDLRDSYRKDYRPRLVEPGPGLTGPEHELSTRTVASVDGLFERIAVREYEMARCRWWAILATVANGLTALAGLILLYLYGLPTFRSAVPVTLLMALSVGALCITLAACIDIISERDPAAVARQIGAA